VTGRLAVRRLAELAPDERARIRARATAAIFDDELRASVGAIVDEVRRDGDAAVARALARFDGVDCPPERLAADESEFAAAREAIDTLKTIVPIWKKEFAEDGAVWIEEHA
jgi:histidinol dehydrogenase